MTAFFLGSAARLAGERSSISSVISATLTEPITFEVDDILASNSRAAIVGALQTRIKSTGKITGTQFAIILTITGDVVTRFQMLEDSFGVSKAART